MHVVLLVPLLSIAAVRLLLMLFVLLDGNAAIMKCDAWSVIQRRVTPFRLNMVANDFNTDDWRDFRARLVAQETKQTRSEAVDASAFPLTIASSSNSAASDSNSWAYETGDIIEEGSVILSRHEHDFCYGLRQQYFHKSIMLVLEHEEATMTDGIILNRPTSHVLRDSDGNVWNLWYGGPVRGMDDDDDEASPAYTCLHSLTNDVARRVSNKIMNNIQWTTLDVARFLVQEGCATPDDFQVFLGFAGWSPGQLRKELRRNNWYMASVDDHTILEELVNTREAVLDKDPFGVETWRRFAERIGRNNNATTDDRTELFDDCMLLEWASNKLLSNGTASCSPPSIPPTRAPGTVMRSSDPFLLDNQEFHKSLLLVLEDTPAAMIGVLLNLPGTESMSINDETIPIRYGGKFGIQGQPEKPITWYHNDESLRNAQVGSPVGVSRSGIWSCTRQDAGTAIEMGLAVLDDFLVVRGAAVFPKKENTVVSLDVLEKFQVVPRTNVSRLWDALLSQEGVSKDTLDTYMSLASSIWDLSGGESDYCSNETTLSNQDLSSVAWKSWVATFLLCDPKLRGS